MEFVTFWLLCCLVVGIIADARGRNGVGWFIISAIISPLLGLILAVALPRIDRPSRPALPWEHWKHDEIKTAADKAPPPFTAGNPHPDEVIVRKVGWWRTITITPGRGAYFTPSPFEAEGVYGGTPYRVLAGGVIEAMMPGGLVRFRNIEHFMAVTGGGDSHSKTNISD